MSFDWLDYLKLARVLSNQSGRSSIKEAKLRSAISRAYYAAYIKARNHLRDKDRHTIPIQDAHRYVINQFLNGSKKGYQALGWQLRQLRGMRTKADYDDDFIDLAVITPEALRLAWQIIVRLDKL